MFRLVAIAVILFSSLIISQNVSGNIQDYFFNVPIEEVAVILKNNADGGVLGTDSTDASGNFSIDYVIVSVDDNKSIPQEYYLSNPYPQPFNPTAKFDFNNPRSGSFDVRIYNIIGQLLYEKNYSIETGRHSFIVSGLGSAGVYLFNISGKDFSSTHKLMLLDGDNRNINVELTAGKNSDLKKINMGDLRIEFRKPGYINKDTVLVWQMNLNVDAKIKQVGSSGSIQFNGLLTKQPTNTPGQNVTITVKDNTTNAVICSTTSFINGYYTCNVNYNSYINPNNISEVIYSPLSIKVLLNGTNYISRDTVITFTGSNLSWLTAIQQSLINRSAEVYGQVRDSITQAGISSAQVNVYKHSDGSLLGSVVTNSGGYYVTNFNFLGYDDDQYGFYNNIGDTRVEASKSGYIAKDTIVSFTISNEVYLDLPIQSYQFNAELRLYKTFKGQTVTDLDSVFVQWSDGSIDGYINNNGVVTINKQLYQLNSDTTAQLFHKHPEQYLKWMIGHRVNPNRPDWLFQNDSSNVNCKIPLNIVNQEGTVEVYLVPKYANYGPDNNTPMDMESDVVKGFYNRNGAFVSGFRPSPAGYDTTDIVQPLFNQTTNDPMPQAEIDRANNEIQKFLTATQWSHKKLLNYRFTQIQSRTNPFFLYLINPNGRNADNVSISTFYNGGPINIVNISLDGSLRIKYSTSKYSVADPNGTIQDEFFDSMLNTTNDDPTHYLAIYLPDAPYTDLAQNLIGISYIFKAGTPYMSWYK